MRFAQEPPAEDEYLITGLWDQVFAALAETPRDTNVGGGRKKTSREHLRQLADAKADDTSNPISTQQANHLIIKRQVPARKGKWRIVPQDVEKPREPAE